MRRFQISAVNERAPSWGALGISLPSDGRLATPGSWAQTKAFHSVSCSCAHRYLPPPPLSVRQSSDT
eukprot:scaffold544_cov117-Isochrysis_galbana.AAC.27